MGEGSRFETPRNPALEDKIQRMIGEQLDALTEGESITGQVDGVEYKVTKQSGGVKMEY